MFVKCAAPLLVLLASTGILAADAPARSTSPADFIDVAEALPEVKLDLRYATTNNFTHQRVYPVARCLLRRGVVERLRRVEAELSAQKLGLKLYDCYRPIAVQRRFWALVPDERYVANPQKGSRHNRGAAVDLTLVDARGKELDMGTGFDDFSPRAHRDASDISEDAHRHRTLLDAAMTHAGFVPMATEWWHFDAPDWESFPFADVPLERRR
jgi:D-alanyl-D-alanine dipeptidase